MAARKKKKVAVDAPNAEDARRIRALKKKFEDGTITRKESAWLLSATSKLRVKAKQTRVKDFYYGGEPVASEYVRGAEDFPEDYQETEVVISVEVTKYEGRPPFIVFYRHTLGGHLSEKDARKYIDRHQIPIIRKIRINKTTGADMFFGADMRVSDVTVRYKTKTPDMSDLDGRDDD